ncbi:MAG: hypothetical protein AAF434_11590 [Pseudomonadota bacterium]
MEPDNIELKVWKDLAVSKQILMRTASDALGLSPDCSADELKVALEAAIAKGNNAEKTVEAADEQSKAQIADIERKLKITEKALAEAQGRNDDAAQGQRDAEHRVTAAREANAKELKKLNEQLAEKQRTIKAIHTALADTPENVVKKLKKLKKEKLDEANACKRAESEVRQLKKDKKKLEDEVEQGKTTVEKSSQLAERYRELYEFCESQRTQLESLAGKDTKIDDLPVLDEHLLESLEGKAGKADPKDKAA